MADTKISALTDAATIVGTEEVPVVQSATTKRATIAELTPGLAASSATVSGIVELATPAESLTGTDTVRAVTPADLRAVVGGGININTVAAAGTTETLAGDTYGIHDVTLDENITFTFTTGVAVAQFSLILRQDGTGTNTVTWPASVKWHAATAPTILTSASAVHVLEFLTVDTGTTWRGFLASSNVS